MRPLRLARTLAWMFVPHLALGAGAVALFGFSGLALCVWFVVTWPSIIGWHALLTRRCARRIRRWAEHRGLTVVGIAECNAFVTWSEEFLDLGLSWMLFGVSAKNPGDEPVQLRVLVTGRSLTFGKLDVELWPDADDET